MDIQEQKQAFLKKINAKTPRQGLKKCLGAALRHNPTYLNTNCDRRDFRRAFAAEIRDQIEQYHQNTLEEVHVQIVDTISRRLSESHGYILRENRLRIGTVQKALNLYLKILWCIDSDWPTPPHCPIDRIILRNAGIRENWTELDSICQYNDWVSKLRAHSLSKGFDSLASWELITWNRYGNRQ